MAERKFFGTRRQIGTTAEENKTLILFRRTKPPLAPETVMLSRLQRKEFPSAEVGGNFPDLTFGV